MRKAQGGGAEGVPMLREAVTPMSPPCNMHRWAQKLKKNLGRNDLPNTTHVT